MRNAIFVTAVALAVLSACTRRPHKIATAPSPRIKKGYTEDGVASWYGYPYHGRKTASGELFDMNRLTAAHRTLPYGVWVEVKNKQNSQKVDVRINDRGPFIDGRIIDLSRAAADVIGLIGPGTAPVRIKVIRTP